MLDVVELCHWFSYHWQIIQSWWLDYSLSFFCIASNIGILQLFKWGWEWIDNEKMFVIVFADIFIFPYLQSQIVSKRSRLCEFHRWPKSADDDAAPPVFAFADQLSHPLSQIQIFMPNTNTNEDANTIVNAIGNKITLAKTDITTKKMQIQIQCGTLCDSVCPPAFSAVSPVAIETCIL